MEKYKHAIFDIETSPKSSVLDGFFMDTPVFRETDVKVGNLKDEAKIAAKIEQAKIDHEKVVSDYTEAVTKKCCLDADYGHVVAIGVMYLDEAMKPTRTDILSGTKDGEATMLQGFWRAFEKIRGSYGQMFGWNIQNFDLPFLIKRSWHLGVEVPSDAVDKYRFFHPVFIDLMKVYTFGGFGKDAYCKLEKACTAFGFIQPEGLKVTGGIFWREWASGDAERMEEAKRYLQNDLDMTLAVACGIHPPPKIKTPKEHTEDAFGGDLL